MDMCDRVYPPLHVSGSARFEHLPNSTPKPEALSWVPDSYNLGLQALVRPAEGNRKKLELACAYVLEMRDQFCAWQSSS